MMASPRWKPETSCHLWMWATNNFLPDGLWVGERLGFTYKTNWTWVKGLPCAYCDGTGYYRRDIGCAECGGTGMVADSLQIGLGQYQRGSHELLLLFTRGKAMVPPPERRYSSVIVAPRGRHSAKPQAAYDVIERVSPGPRLEMFAREPRDGWDCWGEEVPM